MIFSTACLNCNKEIPYYSKIIVLTADDDKQPRPGLAVLCPECAAKLSRDELGRLVLKAVMEKVVEVGEPEEKIVH